MKIGKGTIVLIFTGILACIVAFGIFVYPGIYHYDKYKKYPMKINRLTGKGEVYKVNGWVDYSEEKETSPAQ